jgi:hypothetical protein
MKSETRHAPEPCPEVLGNLDEFERLSRGGEPPPDKPSPHDTQTTAKCQVPLWPLPIVARDMQIPTPPAGPLAGAFEADADPTSQTR